MRKTNIESAIQLAVGDISKLWANISNGNLTKPPVLITLNEGPLIYRNTLTLIQGQQGSHKSRLASLFASLLLTRNNEKSFSPFSKEPNTQNLIIYLDTERNISYELPNSVNQILKNAGYKKKLYPFDFFAIPLVNISKSLRMQILRHFLKLLKKDRRYSGEHIVIVFDVLTDFVPSFNSLEESQALIDELNELINTFDVSIVAIMHENPNSEKSRGHLGTEMQNKASVVVQVSVLPEKTIRLKFIKNRSGELPANMFANFDQNTNSLAFVQGADLVKLDLTHAKLVEPILSKIAMAKTSRAELLKKLQENTSLKNTTLEKVIKRFVVERIQIMTPLGVGYLTKISGKPVYYKIEFS